MLELNGPSINEIKKLIKDNIIVSFCTINNQNISGRIKWCDQSAFKLIQEDGREITLLKQSVMYYSY